MKKIILISLLLIVAFTFIAVTQNPGKWGTGSFAPGDTTETITVVRAKVIYFVFTDSSLTGTDTISILWQAPTNTTAIQYGPISLHEMDQTTTTTDVSSSRLVPGNSSTQVYAWYPRFGDQTITGTFLIRRDNVNDNVTPYLPKTRFAWKYEN